MTGPIIRPGSTAVNVSTGATEQEWPGIADEVGAEALTGTFTQKSLNLSDLADPAAARTSLGLGAAATKSMAQVAADAALTSTFSPLTVAGKTAVRKDDLVYNVLDYGVTGDGTTIDTAAINTLALQVSQAGGGRLHFPRRTYKIGRHIPGDYSSGGVRIYSGVEYHFDNATLLLAENCAVIAAKGALGANATITADTVSTDRNFTVNSSTGFAAGDPVFIRIGQAAYDAGEPDHWLWATVAAIPDGTHITIDQDCGYALTVASVASTSQRSIRRLDEPCENWAITGSVDIVNPMTGSANAEQGVFIQTARFGRIEKVSGINPGSGLVYFQFCDNIDVGSVDLRASPRQNGQISKGVGLAFAEARNVRIGTARLADCEGPFVSAEARTENVVIDTVHIRNSSAARDNTATAQFLVFGNARVRVGRAILTGTPAFFANNLGSADQADMSFGDVTFRTSGRPTITGLNIIDGQLAMDGVIYKEQKTWAKTFTVQPSTSVELQLVAGLIRRLRIYMSSVTGLTTFYVGSAGAGYGPNIGGSLVAGQVVTFIGGQTLAVGTYGGSTAANRDESRKKLAVTCGASLPADTTLQVEVDYYRPSNFGDDYASTGAGAFDTLGVAAPAMAAGLNGSLALKTDVQAFTSTGTWTKPAGAKTVEVIVRGGGGGGGSGRRGAAGTVRCGGGGGGGGAFLRDTVPASALASTMTVTVGAAGTGGAAVTADDTSGNAGTAGGTSNFSGSGALGFAASGGSAGSGGTATTGTGGAGATTGVAAGGAGQSASTTGLAGSSASDVGTQGGGGGSAGGGVTTADVVSAGADSCRCLMRTGSRATGGTAPGGTGAAGTNAPTGTSFAVQGGAGGASSITGAAGAGGAGGNYGCGGAGGGASLNGNNSGAGGAGSPGIVVVTTYF